MAEPLKTLFNFRIVALMGDHLARADPAFDRAAFVAAATDGLEPLELKARAAHIQAALDPLLPADFRAACDVMLASLSSKTEEDWRAGDIETLGISGWAVMPLAEIVAARGMDDADHALAVLAEMTKRFTAEFAVRPFFAADPARAVAAARSWARSDNYHVRRLASEGSRPRLPWGLRLHAFVTDPAPLLPILETLRDDPSDYVRRSVANSLNDIAKDHPDRVARLAGAWLEEAPPDRVRLVRHACRSLVKAGHAGALRALGYGPPALEAGPVALGTPRVRIGEALAFSVSLTSTAATPQPLVVDYVIHHRKANGTTTPKTFKWKTVEIAPGETLALTRRHSFRPVTTRTYHPGRHGVEIQVNGVAFGRTDFRLDP